MKEYQIYTAGKMSGLSYGEQMGWRNEIEKQINLKTDRIIEFVHPPLFYNYLSKEYKTEAEVMTWDLCHIADSDIVIVNLDDINNSIGTHFELSYINALNSLGQKHIYVIGIGKNDESVYPWIRLSLFRTEESIEDAASYIYGFLLV